MSLVIRPCADRHPEPTVDAARDCLYCWKALARPKWRMAYVGTLEGLNPGLRPPTGASRALGVANGPPPCVHLGEPTGEAVECRSCGGSVRLKLRSCAIHGTCTEGKKVDGHGCCRGCPDRKDRPPMPIEWISTARLAADSIRLAGMLPPDVTAVAGIPRSGMIPAAIIAAHLHLPLYQLTEGGELARLGTGGRARHLDGEEAGRLAVIDDTVYAGGAMRRARRGPRGKVTFAAVYVRAGFAGLVDHHVATLGDMHLLEWNVCNSGPFVGGAMSPAYADGIALDLDGVIVHDSESGGPVGSPYLVPRKLRCPLVVTGRTEADRAVTEAQLRTLGVAWDRLVMFPGERTPDDPLEIAAHKARHYAASACGLYVESCPVQAEEIFRLARRPVACPRAGRVWQ